MLMLKKEQFRIAKQFMKNNAQDIDFAMYEYFFENKTLNEVVDILSLYQNDDGGFGKLDYDFEYPYSCLKHTESACRYIFALNEIPQSHPIIKKLIPYIVENFNRITGEWNNLTVPGVNDYPHAPWWAHEDKQEFIPKSRGEMISHYNSNTNAALAGMIVKYSSLVSEPVLEEIKSIPIEKICSISDFGQYEMMSNIYFVNSLNDINIKNNLLKILMGNGKLFSIIDEGFGTENAHKVFNWIDSPNHPYYEMYKDDINKYLDFLIEIQEDNGCWSPNWSYGDSDVRERVKKRLQGELTYKFLWALKKFNRIED